jgi:DNA-binding transcriptional MerR regulator
MPVEIKNSKFYRTSETARIAGISRSTLLRWLADGTIKEASQRDRRGWRLFTEADVKAIEDVASEVK